MRAADFHCALCDDRWPQEVDHIVPVCEGGTGDASNLRALCLACHKRESAALAARRAHLRKKKAASGAEMVGSLFEEV